MQPTIRPLIVVLRKKIELGKTMYILHVERKLNSPYLFFARGIYKIDVSFYHIEAFFA